MRIQRSRDKDGDGDHRGYRTHLIFAGKRDPDGGAGQNDVTQRGSHYYGTPTTLSFSSHSNHPFAQAQPLRPPHHAAAAAAAAASSGSACLPPAPDPGLPSSSRRKGSRGLETEDSYRPGNKQVSFGGSGSESNWLGNNAGVGQPSLQQSPSSMYGSTSEEGNKPGMLEVVAGLSRDCFIIPLACVDRFLPAGLTLPEPKSRTNNNQTTMGTPLKILEVADPQLAVVVHLMTPLMPLNMPAVESPMSQPDRIQRMLATQLLQKAATDRQATHGLLLASMENSSDFPLMALYVVPKLRTDFVDTARKNALDFFDPTNLGYCGDHFFHLCREVATIARPPVDNPAKKGKNSTTGYIISIFRVFDGDDREKLERNWLYWTGARTLYRHLPKSVGLRRITLHKSSAVRGDKLYLLLCECANFLENVNSAAQLLPALRARLSQLEFIPFKRIVILGIDFRLGCAATREYTELQPVFDQTQCGLKIQLGVPAMKSHFAEIQKHFFHRICRWQFHLTQTTSRK